MHKTIPTKQEIVDPTDRVDFMPYDWYIITRYSAVEIPRHCLSCVTYCFDASLNISTR